MTLIEPIRTERLLLREFTEDDLRSVYAYRSDPDVMRYVGAGPHTEAAARDSLATCIAAQREEPRTCFDFAIVLTESGDLAGGCDLSLSLPEQREWALGYILRRDCWSNGYATEAARELLRFGFERLGAHRIIANCAAANTASVRVLEKLGMAREGLRRQQVREGNRWRDTYDYAILDDEWRFPPPSPR